MSSYTATNTLLSEALWENYKRYNYDSFLPTSIRTGDPFNRLEPKWRDSISFIENFIKLIGKVRKTEQQNTIDTAGTYIRQVLEDVYNFQTKSLDQKTASVGSFDSSLTRNMEIIYKLYGTVALEVAETLGRELEQTQKHRVSSGLVIAEDLFSAGEKYAGAAARKLAMISLLLAVLTICAALWFLTTQIPADARIFQVLSTASLRLVVIGVLGTGLGLALSLLRAYLHLRERNSHRREIAKSLNSLVGASTEKEREFIVERAVNEILGFGKSGLISKE